MEIVQTHWGPMERWRAVAMCIGEVSYVINDAARNDTATKRAAAARDAAQRRADAAHAQRRAQYYRDLYDRCDALEAFCDRLLARERERQEARRRADAALMEAEELYTSPPANDDQEDCP
jgi:hypothetical protein